jgi:predicted XRE-type DNA-binding protein
VTENASARRSDTKNIPFEKSSGNVFTDLATAELTVKSTLISTIGDTIRERELTQQEAASLCGTDQPMLSKVLHGRMESVTIDKLAAWLNALGRTVEIHVRPYDRKAKAGQLVIAP